MDITNVFLPQSLNGNLKRGGYIVSGQLVGDTDGLQYGQNVQLQGLSGAGGILDTTWRTFFDGHCLNEPDDLQFDKYSSQAMIELGTVDNLLKGHLQDIGFTEQASPQNNHQIAPSMMVSDLIEHIMTRHCNAIYDASQTPDGIVFATNIDSSLSTHIFRKNVRKSNNLWQRLQEIGGGETSGEFFRPWFNRYNEFFYQPAPAFWSTPPSAVGTLTAEHIRGKVRVKVNNSNPLNRISQVQLHFVGSSLTGGEPDTFDSEYPTTPGEGKIYMIGAGIWAKDQTQADARAELFYKWMTRPYTLHVEVDPALVLFGDGPDTRLDLADAVNVTYDGPADNGGAGVHLQLSAAKFYVYDISVAFDLAGKAAKATLTLEADNG